jgi:peptidoglycan hydrolase CwlO-like protein
LNDDGKLVVESNKGVWVDGEQYVKMYGNFSCNAKTMGYIISQLKNVPVLTTRETNKIVIDAITGDKECLTESIECIINPNAEQAGLLSEISHKDGKIEKLNDEIKKLNKQLDNAYNQRGAEHEAIERFNALPWYKRMFAKICIE